MSVSVIVSNFNGAKYLPRLLQSLKAQQGVTVEIIVVDRNSTDDSSRILAAHSDVKVVQEPPDSGLVAGYAVGVQYARNERFFFCNEDMWFPPDCLRAMEEIFEKNPRVGAVMPYQVRYDGSGIVNTGIWFRRIRWYRGNPLPFYAWVFPVLTEATQVSCVNAGACMISRGAYNEIGGWDTSFFLDHEDDDLAIRLWQCGFVCCVQPASLAFHAVGASNAKILVATKTVVSVKRYISNLSNLLTVGLKYYTGMHMLIPVLIWMDFVLRDATKGRLKHLKLDFLAAAHTVRRAPDIIRFRRCWAHRNRQFPGQHFFSAPEFNVDAIPSRVKDSCDSLISRAMGMHSSTTL